MFSNTAACRVSPTSWYCDLDDLDHEAVDRARTALVERVHCSVSLVRPLAEVGSRARIQKP